VRSVSQQREAHKEKRREGVVVEVPVGVPGEREMVGARGKSE